MKIILLRDVKGTGKKYEVKEASDGYAMNFLIPNQLAERATPQRIKEIEQQKKDESAEEQIQADLLEKELKELKSLELEIPVKANEKGYLFKGLTEKDILKELEKQTNITLPEGSIDLNRPIKEAGKHVISVSIGNQSAKFKLVVTAVE
ncbi:MAG: 50S ribosomal protein L9 [Candidatus Pacebacteria bacterium]|nr:50S ribosomal protein L9 [Candidatus Paceibacterota bacterium]